MTSTALIIVDLQYAFCAEGGALERRGERVVGLGEVLDAVDALLHLAHERRWPVFLTRVVLDSDSSSARALYRRLQADGERHRDYFPDAPDSQLLELPARHPEDRVIDKAGYDPFHDTDLEPSLRAAGVTRLVVGGVLTNVCVESCVRSAFERGFEVLVIEEATGSYSQEAKAASLATIRRGFGEVFSLETFMKNERDASQAS